MKNLEFLSMEPSAIPHPEKGKILMFMRHGNVKASAPGISKDYLTGESILCEMLAYEAQGYCWTSMDVWNFETYNCQLPEAFVEVAKGHYLDHIRSS